MVNSWDRKGFLCSFKAQAFFLWAHGPCGTRSSRDGFRVRGLLWRRVWALEQVHTDTQMVGNPNPEPQTRQLYPPLPDTADDTADDPEPISRRRVEGLTPHPPLRLSSVAQRSRARGRAHGARRPRDM